MNLQEEMLKIKNEMIDEFDKRVEALKEDGREFPQDGDDYWYVYSSGRVSISEWGGFDIEKDMLAIGNIFKTKEQASFVVEKLKVEAELRKYSKPFKEDDDNCFIQINSSHNNLVVDNDECYQTQGTIYFKNRFEAHDAIESVGEERIKKYIFGVEG